MIELTSEQLRALDSEKQPLAAVDPRTGQIYRLIKQDVYELTCRIIGGGPGQVWGDEDDDLILSSTHPLRVTDR